VGLGVGVGEVPPSVKAINQWGSGSWA
jgi:hypothetical protein